MERKTIITLVMIMSLIIFAACGQSESPPVDQATEGEVDNSEEAQENKESLDKWPTETLTLVVPYSSGGSADRQARALAPLLEEQLGVTVIVENREGGGGAVGTMSHLQKDPDDGSYIIYQSHPHFESGIILGAGYEFDDFDILGVTHGSPIGLYVHADSEIETFGDFLEEVENNPGKFSYATMSGSWSDVAGLMVNNEFNLEARGVPFDGGGPMRTSLIAGETDFTYTDIEGMLAGVGDEARALALFASEPYEQDPDVPLINDVMQEMGLDVEFPDMANMRFIQVKKGFKEQYPDRWGMLADAIEKAATSNEYLEWGMTQGMYMTWIGPDEAHDVMKASHDTLMEYKHLFE